MASLAFAAKQIKDCQSMLNKILQSAPEDSDSLAVIRKIIRCDECAPRQAAVCSVALRFFFESHFADYCYRRLEECAKALDDPRKQEFESVRGFLRECETQAAKLLLIGRELQNVDRARLFDIMLWANELFYRSISHARMRASDFFPEYTRLRG